MFAELKAVKKAGFDIRELTPYQFRINHIIDLYPKRKKFHNIKSQERGFYPSETKQLLQFLAEQTTVAINPPAPKTEWEPWWAKIEKGKG